MSSPDHHFDRFIESIAPSVIAAVNRIERIHVLTFQLDLGNPWTFQVWARHSGMKQVIGTWSLNPAFTIPDAVHGQDLRLFTHLEPAISRHIMSGIVFHDRSDLFCVQIKRGDHPIGDLAC